MLHELLLLSDVIVFNHLQNVAAKIKCLPQMQTHSQSKFTSRSVLCHKFAYTTSTTRARLQLTVSWIWTIYLYSSTAHLTLTAPSVNLVCTYSTGISCSTAVTAGLLLPQWKFLALKVYSRDFQRVATTFWFVYLPIGALNSVQKYFLGK